MTKDEFRLLTKEGIILLDGATGTNLQKKGLKNGVCPDQWILDNPEIIKELQRGYLEAGSRILYSPTFSCNRVKLKEYGLEDRIGEMNRALVGLSKETVAEYMRDNPKAKQCYVAGDISMTGVQVEPVGPMGFEELIDIYKEQIGYLAEGGADLIVVETMMSLQETRAAVIACKEVCDLPVMATMTFETDGRTLYGTDPKTALITLQSLGADAFGANCSTGPDRMISIIEEITDVAQIPVICKPNAGLPKLDDNGNTIYDLSPADFGKGMKRIIEAGARIVGGCCGSSPEYIASIPVMPITFKEGRKGIRRLSSERRSLEFSLDDRFMIIGERINPTGKKKLQAELREGSFDMVTAFAEEQEAKGADLLDVNMGMSGVDEKALMLKAIDVVGETTSLPLCIDTSYPEIMEAALRKYPGRALINSISAESDRCDRMLSIAKKYGAMFILLPIGDGGLPKDIKEKKENIDKVLKKAFDMGFKKEDIIVDGLVGTVGALKEAARETLETIRHCYSMGLATTCGLSNISFGLPQRINVNAAFLAMAIESHLTSAIMNPNQDVMIRTVLSADLLMNHAEADIRYIEYMNEHEEELNALTKTASANKQQESKEGDSSGVKNVASPMDIMRETVLKGRKQAAESVTRDCLDKGCAADDILKKALIPAINEVGDLFDKGKYFLPQLISSAETMERSIAVIEPLLQGGGSDGESKTVVIATVEGDIHDIGKNLVALMLKNYGFKVVDLGKNVSKEDIVRCALKEKADLIGLSALMTTTMNEMKNVVRYAKEQGYKGKIMIGGAVVTEEYSREIGADGYSSDASEAVKVARRLVG